MFKTIAYVLALPFFWATMLQAQQRPFQVFYRQHWQLLNPAAVDRWLFHFSQKSRVVSTNHTLLTFGGRQQWLGFEQGPTTAFLSLETIPFERHFTSPKGFRYGGQFFFDRTDAFSSVEIAGNFCKINRVKGGRFVWNVGIQPSFSRFEIAIAKIRLQDPNDPLVRDYRGPRYFIDAGIGLFLRKGTDWFAGVSVPGVRRLLFPGKQESAWNADHAAQLNLMAGRYFSIGESRGELNGWLRWLPGLAYQTSVPDFPISLDGNFRLYFGGEELDAWVGLGLGTNGLASPEFGYVWGDPKSTWFRLGLSASTPLWNGTARFGRAGGLGFELALTYAYDGRPAKKGRKRRR